MLQRVGGLRNSLKTCGQSSCGTTQCSSGLPSCGSKVSENQIDAPISFNQDASDWFKSNLPRSFNHTVDPTSSSSSTSVIPARSPQEEAELDYLSMCGLRTNELPEDIFQKISAVISEFGHKGDLERFGKYMVAKYRSRSCTESPRVLPSSLVPEKSMRVTKTPLERLLSSCGFSELRSAVPELFENNAKISSAKHASHTSISSEDDDKHKLYQMFYSPGSAVTYLAHRFPSTFAANFRVLTEVLKRVPHLNPKHVMDYGSGPGVSALAALKVWSSSDPSSQHAIESITCIEPSQNMQKMGHFMLSDYAEIVSVDWQSGLYAVKEGKKFDLIMVSYVLMEIRDTPSRDLLMDNLIGMLAKGGVLVVVECGTPTGFRFIHRIRELLIEKNIGESKSNSSDKYHIVAPCPHENACPMALTGKDWCHFDQRVLRLPHTLYNKGSRKYNIDLEKFSYLVIRKGVDGPREKYESESLAPTSWEKSYFWPRVVMPAIKAGGHTLVDVCSHPNNFERLVVSKAKPHGFGFRFSRKIMWGDLWRYPKRLARKDARESYTPEKVKEHLDKLNEEVEKTKESLRKFQDEKQLDETFYGH